METIIQILARELGQKEQYVENVVKLDVYKRQVVYCVKNVNWLAAPHGAPELLCIAVTALLHVWKRNNLLSIGVGTVLYMFLVQTVFI